MVGLLVLGSVGSKVVGELEGLIVGLSDGNKLTAIVGDPDAVLEG